MLTEKYKFYLEYLEKDSILYFFERLKEKTITDEIYEEIYYVLNNNNKIYELNLNDWGICFFHVLDIENNTKNKNKLVNFLLNKEIIVNNLHNFRNRTNDTILHNLNCDYSTNKKIINLLNKNEIECLLRHKNNMGLYYFESLVNKNKIKEVKFLIKFFGLKDYFNYQMVIVKLFEMVGLIDVRDNKLLENHYKFITYLIKNKISKKYINLKMNNNYLIKKIAQDIYVSSLSYLIKNGCDIYCDNSKALKLLFEGYRVDNVVTKKYIIDFIIQENIILNKELKNFIKDKKLFEIKELFEKKDLNNKLKTKFNKRNLFKTKKSKI